MFALEQGLESIEVNTKERYEAWKKKRAAEAPPQKVDKKNHDTIALLVLGADGNIAGGCSTSGLGGKLPGRVGDSPILGSGLYVDNEVGAAGATGLGENVMRYCGSFMIVEFMRQGGSVLMGLVSIFTDRDAADLETYPVDVFRCPKCGRLEMYDLDFSLPAGTK